MCLRNVEIFIYFDVFQLFFFLNCKYSACESFYI